MCKKIHYKNISMIIQIDLIYYNIVINNTYNNHNYLYKLEKNKL